MSVITIIQSRFYDLRFEKGFLEIFLLTDFYKKKDTRGEVFVLN